MNKQEFYNAFMKGVTCAITSLLIIFAGLFCFYTGYKFGRERVLDCDPNLVNVSNVQTHSIGLQPMDTQSNVFEFVSSPFLLPFSPVLSGTHNTVDNISFSNIQFRFFSDGNRFDLSYKIAGSYLHVEGDSINNAFSFDDIPWSTFNVPDNNWHDYVLKNWSGYPLSNSYDFLARYLCQPGFISNISFVVISPLNNVYNSGLSGVELKFVDVNSITFQFQLLGPSGVFFNTYFDYVPSRTIYFASDLTDNDYYNSGYEAGYTAGENDGIQSGYNNGYSVGDTVGYNRGFDAGVNAGNQYTFSSLLTAVIDAPVHVFIDLLDFNIMGYNLLNLVVGLLTFAVIALILKLILGGK